MWLYNCSEGVACLIEVCLQYKHKHQLNREMSFTTVGTRVNLSYFIPATKFATKPPDSFQTHLKACGFACGWKFGVVQGNLNHGHATFYSA